MKIKRTCVDRNFCTLFLHVNDFREQEINCFRHRILGQLLLRVRLFRLLESSFWAK